MNRPLEALQRAVGVTRLARITGLDRTGIEVACAIRPAGHVLQVCNGKGVRFEDAAIGALMEATELYFAEHPQPGAITVGSVSEIAAQCDEVWGPDAVGGAAFVAAPALSGPEIRTGWSFGVERSSGARIAVPSAALYCPPPGGVSFGPAAVSWSSNGMGAHFRREDAIRHALFEAAERDQLARAAPEGWTQELVRTALLPEDGTAPVVAGWVKTLRERHLEAAVFELAPAEGGLGLHVAGVLLIDRLGGPIPLTAGYACRASREAAQLAALLEAGQSRLTDVHGAREDVAPMETADVTRMIGWIDEARRVARRRRPPRRHTAELSASQLPRTWRAAGHPRIGVFDLAPPEVGVHVVKVVVPTFEMTGLL